MWLCPRSAIMHDGWTQHVDTRMAATCLGCGGKLDSHIHASMMGRMHDGQDA